MRRLLKWVAIALAGVAVLFIALLIVARTPWGLERARRLIESRASSLLADELHVDQVRGSLFGDVQLVGVKVGPADAPVIVADEIRVRYRPFEILMGRFVIDDIVLTRPTITVVQDERGWNVARLAKPRTSTGTGESRPFSIRRAEIVDGRLSIQTRGGAPHRLDALALETGVDYRDRTWRLDIRRGQANDVTAGVRMRELRTVLSFGGNEMSAERLVVATDQSRLTGRVRSTSAPDRDRTLDVLLDAAPLSLPELSRFVPGIPASTLTPTLHVQAQGPLHRLNGSWTLASPVGGRTAGTFMTAGDRRIETISGTADVVALDLQPWFARPALASRLTGRGTFEITELAATPRVNFTFDGTRLAMAGYEASRLKTKGTYYKQVVDADVDGIAYGAGVRGRVRWETPTRHFASTGHVTQLNLVSLPAIARAPRLQTRIAGAYEVDVLNRAWRAGMTFEDSVVEGADIAAGSRADVDGRTAVIAYHATGRIANLDAQRLARAWPELPRKLETLPGHITTTFDVDGRGGGLDTATFRGTFTDLGGTITGIDVNNVDATVLLDRRRLTADLRGDVRELTHAQLGVPEAHAFSASARPDLHLVIHDVGAPLTFDAIDVRGSVELSAVNYRGLRADRVAWVGSFVGGTADIKTLEVTGPDVNVKASGILALAGEDQSDLTYLADVANLAVLEKFTGQSLAGAVRIEGRLTGPPNNLSTTGELRGTQLAALTFRALSLDAKFTATVRDQQWHAVNVTTDANAAFVEAGSVELDRVLASIKYSPDSMEVEARLESKTRTLQLAGNLVPHPDHREVHLRRLVVSTGPAEWTFPANREAVIQYGANRIRIDGLELMRGDSVVRVSGVIGESVPAETPLLIQAERVLVEDINQLMLGTHQLSGELNANVRVTGTLNDPRASGRVTVVRGAADGVTFDELAADVTYATRRLGLDLTLNAGANGSLTARGSVPIGGTTAADRFDLRVESAGVNLGLFQPVTPALTALAGKATFDLRVIGPASAPEIAGSATIADGAFTVPYTGMTYRGLQAAIDVRGRQLTVNRFTIQDEDKHALTLQGGFSLAGGEQSSAFDLYLSGTEFHVIKNHLGDVAVTLDLHANGDLNAPLLTGTIDVVHATIEVDDVLDQLRSTGYVALPSEEVSDTRDTFAPGALSGASYSVTLALPDSVVLRGRDLRVSSGPIGLGTINLTVGGALAISKNPGETSEIRGELDVIRGNYEFQGRRFNIVRGSSIAFGGESMLDPRLDVTAERQISGVVARLRVTGTARHPEIALTSTPALAESDILSLIVFNQPTNELLAGERVSLAATAGVLAARAVATPLADSVARALDLDLFEIRPSDIVEGGVAVSIEEQVGERVFIGFRHDFGPTEVSQVSFEYRLTELIRVVTTFAEGTGRTQILPRVDRAGIDLIYVIRR